MHTSFFFKVTAPAAIYTLSLHDALPIYAMVGRKVAIVSDKPQTTRRAIRGVVTARDRFQLVLTDLPGVQRPRDTLDRKSTRLNSSHSQISYAVFCLKKKKNKIHTTRQKT